jgi:hypothetical protein
VNIGSFEWVRSNVDNKEINGVNHSQFIFYFIIWCILFFIIFLRIITFFNRFRKIIGYHTAICSIIFLFTFTITKSNYYVSKIYENGPIEKVTFDYSGNPNKVSTDSTIYTRNDTIKVFIGILKDYMFIGDASPKDFKSKKFRGVQIYDLKDVKNLVVQRIRD